MKKAYLALVCVMFAPMFLVGVSSSAAYDPWSDLDADGDIDFFDIVKIAEPMPPLATRARTSPSPTGPQAST